MSEKVERELIPEGRYPATIQDIGIPEMSKLRPGQFHVRIRMRVESQDMFMAVGGYFDAMVMLYESREYWAGRTVEVRVKHRAHNDGIYAVINVQRWRLKESTPT